MKILIINQILYTHSDGVIPQVDTIKDTMIYQMCKGFLALGHEVTLAAASEYKPQKTEQYDFEVLWFKSDFQRFLPPTLLPCSLELRNFIKNNGSKFDMIISKEVFSLSSLWSSVYYSKKTLLWVEQANHQRKFHQLPSKFWLNIISRHIMTKVRSIVPCSEKSMLFLNKYMSNVSNEIIEHGIDICKFTPALQKKRQLIVSSQLIKRKSIDSIIRIFATLHNEKEYSDINLLIAGRGPEELYLRDVAKNEKVDKNVVFLGFVSQTVLNQYVSESLALLINTKSDMNMVSVPESVCSATPIIMNQVPLNCWYVRKYNLGIVKNNWDKNDIKNIIDRNDYYVDNCKKYRDQLSLTSTAKKLIDIFEK